MKRTALITGASSGIGAASAVALAERGFAVCLTARREERLAELAEKINAGGETADAIYLAGDATDATFRQATLDQALDRLGRLDVLVSSAGIALSGAVEDLDLGAVREQFEINLFAALGWMQLVGPVMREQGGGRIINIGSISGRIVFPTLGAYSASKFALEAISDAARIEYASHGVDVILIDPGSIATEIWQRSQDFSMAAGKNWQESPFRSLYLASIKHAEKLMAGHGPPPSIVARAVCCAAMNPHPKPRYYMPLEAKVLAILAHLPTRLRDRIVRWILTVENSAR